MPTIEPAQQLHTTAYCTGTTTASGTPAREGVAATDRSHMGCTALVFENKDGEPGELLEILSCEDTGKGGDLNKNGIGDIIEGRTIDVYRNDLEGVRAWAKRTNDEVWVIYIK